MAARFVNFRQSHEVLDADGHAGMNPESLVVTQVGSNVGPADPAIAFPVCMALASLSDVVAVQDKKTSRATREYLGRMKHA
jgi:hypothetical protein